MYRARVAMAFMKSGIPLEKLECPEMRSLLEQNAFKLTDKRHMIELVPFVLDQERKRIQEEVKGKCISVIFDGTTRLGEVLAVVVRFVDDRSVKQCLVCLDFLQKSMNGEELARELRSTLSVMLGIESNKFLSFMRDRASMNTAAMGIVGVVYPTVLSIGCMSDALESVDDKFNVPNLHHFLTFWLSLFAHSPRVKALWNGRTDRAMASYSTTRWWSRWEVMNQVLQLFGDIEPFLKDHDDISPATRTMLMQILSNPQRVSFLTELTAVIDIGSYFVKATCNLEGDGILAVTYYEEVLKIHVVLHRDTILMCRQ